MATINTNTAVTVPAGALLKFAPGGQGRAVDSDGNSYVIGRSDVRCGPYAAAKTFQILVTAGPINYVIDADGSADDTIRVNEFSRTLTTSPEGAEAVAGAAALRYGDRMAVVGDSFAFASTGGNIGVTLSRSNGVVTVTGATSHTFYPGSKVSVVGCAAEENDVQGAVVSQYVSSSSFRYPHSGDDGPIAVGPQGASVICPHVRQSAGFFSHYNRLTGGAYRLVANCGIPGARTDFIASRVASALSEAAPNRVIWIAGYNDINGDKQTLDQTVENVIAAVTAHPNALWDVFTPWPWNSGAAADSAVHLRQLGKYYRAMKEAFSTYRNVRVHNSPQIVGASTGYAATGVIKSSDNIHPAWRGMHTVAKYLHALDAGTIPTGVQLPTTALDTYTLDATSKHLVDSPLMTGSGGALTNVTGTISAGVSGALTGTGASGAASVTGRADGFGSDLVVTYTPANADNALRISWAIPVARFTSGGMIDKIGMKVSVSGLSGGNPANLKSVQMTFIWIADGVTYAASAQEASADAQTAAHSQQEDIVDLVFCLRDIPVPVFASLTTARLDLTTSHYASGSAITIKVGRVDCELA